MSQSIIIGSSGIKNDQDYNRFPQTIPVLTQTDFDYLKSIQAIRSILPWIIFSVGILGNFLILCIFIRKRGKRRTISSNGFCFCALAITDTLALILMVMSSLLNVQIVTNFDITCRLIKYTYYVFLELSSWSLVLLTVDRFIAVVFLFKYDYWSKKLTAIKIFIGLAILLMLLNLHLLFYVGTDLKAEIDFTVLNTKDQTSRKPNKPLYVCSVSEVKHPFYYKHFYSKWDIYHAIIYGALPFLIILICNISIILQLTVLKNKNFVRSSIQIKGDNEALSSLENTETMFDSKQAPLMLLSVAFVFLLFTSPISIYMVAFYDHLSSVRGSKREFIKVVLRYIGYCNNAINFYLYLLLSKEFRKEFLNAVKTLFGFSNPGLCTTSTSIGSLDENKKTLTRVIRKRFSFKKKVLSKIEEKDEDEYESSTGKPFISNNNRVINELIRESENEYENEEIINDDQNEDDYDEISEESYNVVEVEAEFFKKKNRNCYQIQTGSSNAAVNKSDRSGYSW